MPEKYIISTMRQILQGLKFVHDRGALHSDLKPANIFLKEDGAVMVADFGCAVILDTMKEKEVRSVHGTRGYMPPEQIRMEGVGPSADIFSCGCVGYELANKNTPFDAESE